MVISSTSCTHVSKREKFWKYHERYTGEKDAEHRRNEQGQNYWSGAKSLEWYNGKFFRDTMHGTGEYRWRHAGPEGVHFTYEGHFFGNNMHGYGTVSYPDGKVFKGLFHTNVRWGPGVQSHARLEEDVGLWRGTQLVRMSWKPEGPGVAPDFNTTSCGRALVETKRVKLRARCKEIEETNSALDLLKRCGVPPEVWQRLYPKNCTDLSSSLCRVQDFEHDYYCGSVQVLEEVPKHTEATQPSTENQQSDLTAYFSWNNNRNIIEMMKHSYTHEWQRNNVGINVSHILSGLRNNFKPAGNHEKDCRTLLMASYLGNVAKVVSLINEHGVNPDVSDGFGNSAIMYATCGDIKNIIHFLAEAGANVNCYNDSCCTPLGVALLRLVCDLKDIRPNEMVDASIPTPVTTTLSPLIANMTEWNMEKTQVNTSFSSGLNRTTSRMLKNASTRRLKSVQSFKDTTHSKKILGPYPTYAETNSNDSIIGDKREYHKINQEYHIKLNDIYYKTNEAKSVQYNMFNIRDMVNEVNGPEEDIKKTPEKNPTKILSKIIKETIKPSENVLLQSNDKKDTSIINIDNEILHKRKEIMESILQLLADGANPKLVNCPKPALFLAIISGCNELVKHLVDFGADINEVYDETFGYTPLDLAVSLPFSNDNLNTIRTVLACGANSNRRLPCNKLSSHDLMADPCLGPTLLHAVLARKTENVTEKEVQSSLLELLLEYKFDPTAQYNGCSSIDVALSKKLCLLDVFVKSPVTNLNSIINSNNETILTKIFSIELFRNITPAERIQCLSNLLAFGSDPLLECAKGDETFSNLFVYAKRTLADLESVKSKPPPASVSKKPEPKQSGKSKKDQVPVKAPAKLITDDIEEYKISINFVLECSRLLHIRWLQASLTKELIGIIEKYKHRHWNMIIKEHNNKNSARLWLTPSRCLDIWEILKTTKRKVFSDSRVLQHLLCIVMYYNSKPNPLGGIKILAEEKSSIDNCVENLLKERKNFINQNNSISLKCPELTAKRDERKFNVCFECALPFSEEKTECSFCKIVSFCSFECLKTNIERPACHPCSDMLKTLYKILQSSASLI